VAAKYDSGTEAEVRSWFQSLLNENLQPGMRQVEDQLRNGQLLCRSVNVLTYLYLKFLPLILLNLNLKWVI